MKTKLKFVIASIVIIFIAVGAFLYYQSVLAEYNTFHDKVLHGKDINSLIIGDSIGGGISGTDWCVKLSNRIKIEYNSDCNVTNLSLPGNSSFAGYSQLQKFCTTDELVDLIVICFGQNDADDLMFPIMYENIIRTAVTNFPNAAIVAILESSQRDYTNKIQTIIEICDHYNVPYADTLSSFNGSGYEYDELTSDGIHPNVNGKELYCETVYDTLKTNYIDKNTKVNLNTAPLNQNCANYEKYLYFDIGASESKMTFEIPEGKWSGIGLDIDWIAPGQKIIVILPTGEKVEYNYSWEENYRQKTVVPIAITTLGIGEVLIEIDGVVSNNLNGIILFGSN